MASRFAAKTATAIINHLHPRRPVSCTAGVPLAHSLIHHSHAGKPIAVFRQNRQPNMRIAAKTAMLLPASDSSVALRFLRVESRFPAKTATTPSLISAFSPLFLCVLCVEFSVLLRVLRYLCVEPRSPRTV